MTGSRHVITVVFDVRSLDQDAKHGGHLAAELLTSKANQIGTRDHGDVGEDKDGEVVLSSVAHSYSSRDKRPEDVDSGRDLARGDADDLEEMERRKAPSATLTGGLDTRGERRVAIAIVVSVLDGITLDGGKGRIVGRSLAGLFGGDGHVPIPIPVPVLAPVGVGVVIGVAVQDCVAGSSRAHLLIGRGASDNALCKLRLQDETSRDRDVGGGEVRSPWKESQQEVIGPGPGQRKLVSRSDLRWPVGTV